MSVEVLVLDYVGLESAKDNRDHGADMTIASATHGRPDLIVVERHTKSAAAPSKYTPNLGRVMDR
jgi:hypothetical protein